MASPRALRFCWAPSRAAPAPTAALRDFQPRLWHGLCLGSALLGLLGVLLLLGALRRHKRGSRRAPDDRLATARALRAAAIASGCLGAAGILVRSVLWLAAPSGGAAPLCILVLTWVQYWFAAHFWALFGYSLEAFLLLRSPAGHRSVAPYHLLCWGLPATQCLPALLLLLLPPPTADEHCSSASLGLAPILDGVPLAATYIPLALALLGSPVLFSRALRAGVRRHEVGGLLLHRDRRQPPLHRHRPHLALGGLHLPHHGAGGGGRERLGGRAVLLHLQHPAARLQERLLRPLLPHLPHPPLGPAAHPGDHAGPAGGHARGLPAAPGEEVPGADGPRRRQAPGGGQEAQDAHLGRPLVDLRLQRGLPHPLRGHLHVHLLPDLPRLPDDPAGQVRRLPLPQHRGLLRLAADREDHLHGVHAGHLWHLHRAQPGRAALPDRAGLRPAGQPQPQPLLQEGLLLPGPQALLRVQAERDQPAADRAGGLPEGHSAPQLGAAREE